MKILLINSDLARNRGDRAIAEGLIALAKKSFPDAEITGISEGSERDEQWFGIQFLSMDTQSLNPLDFLRLLKAARQSDFILWGGGELLKDYTNKLGLWYWTAKIGLLSLANKNIYGTYQGIGPTRSTFSRKLIVWVVNRTRIFITRDQESADKLKSWGVKNEVIASSDPAIYPQTGIAFSAQEVSLLQECGITTNFLENCVGIGPRKWFHYAKSGLLPFKYRNRFKNLFGRQEKENPTFVTYKLALTAMVNQAISARRNVLLVPMHMGANEADITLCEELQSVCSNPEKVVVLKDDILPPALLRKVIAHLDYFVGCRLHSTILSASAGVPSINYYYVDKGRQFFEQIHMEDFSAPVEKLLEEDFASHHQELVFKIEKNHQAISEDLLNNIEELRGTVAKHFERIYEK